MTKLCSPARFAAVMPLSRIIATAYWYIVVNARNMTKEDAKQRVIEKWNRRTKNA